MEWLIFSRLWCNIQHNWFRTPTSKDCERQLSNVFVLIFGKNIQLLVLNGVLCGPEVGCGLKRNFPLPERSIDHKTVREHKISRSGRRERFTVIKFSETHTQSDGRFGSLFCTVRKPGRYGTAASASTISGCEAGSAGQAPRDGQVFWAAG